MYHNKYKVPYAKSLKIDDMEPANAKMRPMSLEEKAEALVWEWEGALAGFKAAIAERNPVTSLFIKRKISASLRKFCLCAHSISMYILTDKMP